MICYNDKLLYDSLAVGWLSDNESRPNFVIVSRQSLDLRKTRPTSIQDTHQPITSNTAHLAKVYTGGYAQFIRCLWGSYG